MSFDIDQTFKDMLGAAKAIFESEWPKAKDAVEQVLNDEREALQNIAVERLKGNITEEDFKSHLEKEKLALEAGLSMLTVIAKATIQKAVNAAIEVFWKAVKAAV